MGAETDGEDAWGRGAGEACRWEGGMGLVWTEEEGGWLLEGEMR